MKTLTITKAPNEAFALTNCVVVHPDDFDASYEYVQINGRCVASIAVDRGMERGQLGTSSFHRTWLKVSLNEPVQCVPIKHLKSLEKLDIQVYNFIFSVDSDVW